MSKIQMFVLIVFLLMLFFATHAMVGCSKLLKHPFFIKESEKNVEEVVSDVTEEELEQGINK